MDSNGSTGVRAINYSRVMSTDMYFYNIFCDITILLIISVAILYMVTVLTSRKLRRETRQLWPVTAAVFILVLELLTFTERITWDHHLPSWRTVYALTCILLPIQLASDDIIMVMFIAVVTERVHSRIRPSYVVLTKRAALTTILVTVVLMLAWEYLCVHGFEGGLTRLKYMYTTGEGASQQLKTLDTYIVARYSIVRAVHHGFDEGLLHIVLIIITCVAIHQYRKADSREGRHVVLAAGTFCLVQIPFVLFAVLTATILEFNFTVLRLGYEIAYAGVLAIWLACDPLTSHVFRTRFCPCLRKNADLEIEAELLDEEI